MLGRALAIRILLLVPGALCACNVARAQIDAPSALTQSSGCAHNTCAWVPSTKHKTFNAGDLTYTVEVKPKEDTGGDFVLRRAGKELLRARLEALSASVSVVWSTDKRNFAITWTNGGEVGGFQVRVFHIEGDSIIELPATRAAIEAFEDHHWCAARGDSVQAHSWLPDSRALVLVLSINSTADCGRDVGHTEGYLVDAPTGKIREHWSIKQLNAYMEAHPE